MNLFTNGMMELTIDDALRQGIAAHKEGKLEDAERFYRAILNSNPQRPDANHNLGVLAVGLDKTEEALPFFKTALESEPKQGQFWLSYIDALIKIGHLDNAREILRQGRISGLKGDNVDGLERQLTNTESANSPSIDSTGNPSQQQIDSLFTLYSQNNSLNLHMV